jgi:hypothetical protein
MLMKRNNKNGIIEVMYDSSNILSSIYDEDNTNDLIIVFKNGGKYKYPKVSKADYMRFEMAESQGVVFNSHIKKYAFEKLENISVDDLMSKLNESNELKNTEKERAIKAKRDFILSKIKQIAEFDENVMDEVLLTQFSILKQLLEKYLNIRNED